MVLLVIVAVWSLYHYTQWHHAYERIAWYETYVSKVDSSLNKFITRDNIRYIVILFIPLFVAWLVTVLFRYSHYHIVRFVFDTLVLWYCWLFQEHVSVIPGTLRDQTRYVFSDVICQGFTSVFWYIIAGPLGALLYDFVRRSQRTRYAPYAVLSRYLLEWPAARILALGYALAGHFSPAFSCWALNIFTPIERNQQFLENCGLAALNGNYSDPPKDEKEVEYAKSLVRRAQVILLIVIAVFALGSLMYS